MYRGNIVLFLLTLVIPSAALASDVSLKEKLLSQFQKYDRARETVSEVVGRESKTIDRQQWEKLLAVPDDEQMTSTDLKTLEAHQEKVIRANAMKAKRASRLNIETLRANGGQRAEFCSEIPKGGMLHIHIGGTPDHATVSKLLDYNNPALSFNTVYNLVYAPHAFFYPHEIDFLPEEPTKYSSMSEQLQKEVQGLFFFPAESVLPPAGENVFDRFSGLFVVNTLIKDKPNQAFFDKTIYDDFLARAHREHVTYIEITTSAPLNSNFNKYFEGWMEEARDFGIELRFNYSFNRAKKSEDNRKLAQTLVQLPQSPAVVGIDLLSDETSTPALEQGQSSYATVLAAVEDGRSQLHRTMHAGELGDSRNVRDALILGAERIGHGVKLKDDIVTLEYARRMKLPVEINLVSNIRLRSIDDIHNHPFLRYLRLGLRPSLSTDDEGMLETDINKECETAIADSDVSYAELKQMSVNSIETSFAPDSLKKKLESKLATDFAAFEKEWSQRLRSR